MPIGKTYDYTCEQCGRKLDRHIKWEDEPVPRCCKQEMFREFPVPFTDVKGCERTSKILTLADGTPLSGTSTREEERKMAAMGYEPAGDKVGGARNESHLNLGKIYSGGVKPAA